MTKPLSKNHFVIDISTTNDINDQNQLYVMAKDAVDLLETKSSTVIADTGYYNGTEIKKCIDDGMKVFIKRQKPTIVQKITNFVKRSFLMIRIMMFISARQVIVLPFLKTLPRME